MTTARTTEGPGPAPLLAAYRGVVCDLDGVVYIGDNAVPHAIETLAAIRAAGLPIVYATNNASRPPAEVAEHLGRLGVALDVADVVTSSQAGARRLADELPEGSAVLAVGGPGVVIALEEVGLAWLRAADVLDHLEGGGMIAAVLQGFGKDVSWRDLSEAAFAIRGGARWVATNNDFTLPLERGIAPGNGSLVAAVRRAVGVDPVVVGKPHTPLYEVSAGVLGTTPQETLAIGDRLDTDIEGAVSAGIDALHVMTGVSRLAEVALADATRRPTFLALDLRAVGEPYAAPRVGDDGHGSMEARCGDAVAAASPRGLVLGADGDANQRLRAVIAAVWALRDSGPDGAAAVATWGGEELGRAQGWVDEPSTEGTPR